MDEQDRNLTPEGRLSTADLAAKTPCENVTEALVETV